MAVCYSGDLADVDEALAPIRALGDPVVDLLHEQPYTQVQSYLDATEPKGMHYYWKTEYLAELSDGFLSALAATLRRSARSRRRRSASSTSAARSTSAPRTTARSATATRARSSASRACGSPANPTRDAFSRWIRDAWMRAAAVLDRPDLHQLPDRRRGRRPRPRDTTARTSTASSRSRRRYDPDNLFRSNRNVRPR